MAIHTLGTVGTASLSAVTYNPPQGVGVAAAASLLAPADLASIAQAIVSDVYAQATNPLGVKTTGTTNSNTTVNAIASMTRIQAGMTVLGVGIVPGTSVQAVNVGGSSITLSQAATASAAGVNLLFVPPVSGASGQFGFQGQLYIPRRGVLQVLPGDVVAVDNTGWPILISAASIAAAGSRWSLV